MSTYKKKITSGVSSIWLKIDGTDVQAISETDKWSSWIFTDNQTGYVTATQAEYEAARDGMISFSTDGANSGHVPHKPG
jgi:hypothetical protein